MRNLTMTIAMILTLGSLSYADESKADQVGGILGELRVVPNGWSVRFDNNWDGCGANGKFVTRNSSDLPRLADAVMSGRQVQFQFHCDRGLHVVDSWGWR